MRTQKGNLFLMLLKLVLFFVNEGLGVQYEGEEQATEEKPTDDIGKAILAHIVVKALD